MEQIISFFEELIEELEGAFNESIGINDYLNENVPLERVVQDRNKCINMLGEYFKQHEVDVQSIEIAVAIYCNFYVKCGMQARFDKVKDTVEFGGIKEKIEDTKYPVRLKKVYSAILEQDFTKFDELLNEDSTIAKLYLFVKECWKYSNEEDDNEKHEQSAERVIQYEKMWELYEGLPDEWKRYALGEGELIRSSGNRVLDLNFLPYIEFVSIKDCLTEIILENYEEILGKLNISIDEESGHIFYSIMKNLGYLDIYDSIMVASQKGASNQSASEFFKAICKIVPKSIGEYNKVNWEFTVLFEKLHDLCGNSLKSEWVEKKDFLQEDMYINMTLAERSAYLHLGVLVNIKRSLFKSHYQLFCKNRLLQKSMLKKQEMMDYYAHSWKHIAYPQIVKSVADELSKTNISLANRLIKAYNSEQILQRGIQLLQYVNSDDKYAVRNAFRDGFSKVNREDGEVVDILTVIQESLDIVVFKILMTESDDSTKIRQCREQKIFEASIDQYRNEYTKLFIENDKKEYSIVEWVSKTIIPLQIEIDEEWRAIRFKQDHFAINQFKEILVEIFTNAFMHGSGYFNLNFTSKEDEMHIRCENKKGLSNPGTGRGLNTMKNLIESINIDTQIQGVFCKEYNDTYTIDVGLNKKLMYRRGR